MASIRGYRCSHCRAEVVAPASPPHPAVTSPTLLCCGQPVRPVETGQVVAASLPRHRVARCPRCGFEVRVVVRPEGPLVCRGCGRELAIREGVPGKDHRTNAPAEPMRDPRR